ncbi:PA2169 family four-helix-bundle protein [Mucilaginibacter sp.]|uniref:ferritin-like domain-containing protein n=1 Tax=Mucilaginibacter sp. TaxID=1882438 RepID=UPI0026304685|nr:PA2169 family four-helix-bundle protein [Mucilaginibacter sp.]MDB5032746.1 family four-helix-bundle protein [Mucilaginibacter sp.]
MERNKEIIETLNDLVQINNDRIAGYENAIKETKDDGELVSVFNNKILESQQFKSTLAREIQVLGSDVDNDTSVSGTIHRTWLEIKATFTGHSEKSILEECEFGEDAIKKAYQSALNRHLPAYIRDILNDQQAILQQSHDEIKALRDSVHHQHH